MGRVWKIAKMALCILSYFIGVDLFILDTIELVGDHDPDFPGAEAPADSPDPPGVEVPDEDRRSPVTSRILLPPELVDRIISFADPSLALLLVSRRHYELVVPRLYDHVSITSAKQLKSFASNAKIFYCKRIRSIRISIPTPASVTDLADALYECTSIKELNIEFFVTKAQNTFECQVKLQNALKRLTLLEHFRWSVPPTLRTQKIRQLAQFIVHGLMPLQKLATVTINFAYFEPSPLIFLCQDIARPGMLIDLNHNVGLIPGHVLVLIENGVDLCLHRQPFISIMDGTVD